MKIEDELPEGYDDNFVYVRIHHSGAFKERELVRGFCPVPSHWAAGQIVNELPGLLAQGLQELLAAKPEGPRWGDMGNYHDA